MISREGDIHKIISLPPPAIHSFLAYARLAERRVIVVSPFITSTGIKYLLQVLPDTPLTIDICSRFDKQTFFQGSSEYSAFSVLSGWNDKWKISFYKMAKLHAKVFIFDDMCIVTSANLTLSGLRFNYEFGIAVPAISLIDQLGEHIDSILTDAIQIDLEKIEEIALSAGKRMIMTNKEGDKAFSFDKPQLKDNEDIEPDQFIVEKEEELDRIKKFEERLENILSTDINQPPFGYLEVFNILRECNYDLNDSRVQQALEKDFERIDSFLSILVSNYNLLDEAKNDMFYSFVHRSFLHLFKPDLLSDAMNNRQTLFRDIGINVLKLFHAHNCFSGNYLWQEEIGFFVIKTNLMESWFRPRFVLEELGGRWCIHYGDMKKEWEDSQAKKLIGIIFYWNQSSIWDKLNSFMDSDTYMVRSAFDMTDAKTALQEELHKHVKISPTYQIVETTESDHILEFTVSVSGLGCSATGKGKTKKAAEKSAAIALLKKLRDENKIGNTGIIERKRIERIKPYFLEDYFYYRVKDLRAILPLRARQIFIDCALTTPRERNLNRDRRSNEKFAFIGSILRDIYFKKRLAENILEEREISSINLSANEFVMNFAEMFSGWRSFSEKYYNNATKKELASVCEALLGVAWADNGWEGIEPFLGAFQSFDKNDPITLLQSVLQNVGKEPPKYEFKIFGPSNERKWVCLLFLEDKLVAESTPKNNKREGKRETALAALAMLDKKYNDG